MRTDETFKQHRRVLNVVISNKFIKQAAPRISKAALGLIELWSEKMKIAKERGWDCRTDAAAVSLDAIGSWLTHIL
jgi:hypothetical protein